MKGSVKRVSSAGNAATVSIYLHDPDGNGLELYYDRPRSEWFNAEGAPNIQAVAFDAGELVAELRSSQLC